MAKSRSIGSIFAELSLKDEKFSKGLKSADAKLKKFGMASAKWAGAGLATGLAGSSAALLVGTKRTLGMTDELVDMSSQTGLAIADMMLLQQAYKDGGRGAEMAGKDIAKMQKSLVTANSGGSDPFTSMGLSAAELIKLDPADQFQKIGAAIMRIQNPAERTAKAMEIFGKGGMGLTTVFDGLPAAEKALGRMPELAQRFGAAMGEANDLIGHLPLKSDQFFMGFTAGIIGELLPALGKIDAHDFTTVGENLGTSLAMGISSLADGSAWAIFETKGMAAISRMYAGTAGVFSDELAKSFTTAANVYEAAGKGLAMNLQYRLDANREAAAASEFSGKAAATAPHVAADTRPISDFTFTPPAAAASRDVNEYQRRGLSLDGGNQVAAKTAETNNILREMQATIKRMEANAMTASF